MSEKLELENKTRREFLKVAAGAAAVGVAGLGGSAQAEGKKRQFGISLAAWSLHREVFGGKLKVMDAFKVIREEFDIDAFELVNTMLEVPTASYVTRLFKQGEKYHIKIPLIMCDDEGAFGDSDPEERAKAVRNHEKWVYIAQDLGCYCIRVNWRGSEANTEHDPAKAKEFIGRSVDSYKQLVDIGDKCGIKIIIENHGGPSSYPEILTGLMKAVGSPNFGTLPDYGNFPDDVDRYDAVDKMMPYAKAVSAKCYDFGPDGKETKLDYEKLVQICVDKHGYHGNLGIEYEGNRMSERDGVKACKALLVKLRG